MPSCILLLCEKNVRFCRYICCLWHFRLTRGQPNLYIIAWLVPCCMLSSFMIHWTGETLAVLKNKRKQIITWHYITKPLKLLLMPYTYRYQDDSITIEIHWQRQIGSHTSSLPSSQFRSGHFPTRKSRDVRSMTRWVLWYWYCLRMKNYCLRCLLNNV